MKSKKRNQINKLIVQTVEFSIHIILLFSVNCTFLFRLFYFQTFSVSVSLLKRIKSRKDREIGEYLCQYINN